MVLPARRTDVMVTAAGTDVLVYDNQTNQLHTLPESIATVWDLCDGRKDTGTIAREALMPEVAVVSALGQLREAGLLEGEQPAVPSRRDRRTLLKRAVAGAAIVSVTAPLAAQAISVAGSCWWLDQDGVWNAYDQAYEVCQSADSCFPGGGGGSSGGCYKWTVGPDDPFTGW